MARAAVNDNGYKELTREEGRELFDRLARGYLRMSGAEFVRAWEAGDFQNDAEQPEVAQLVMLMPLAA